MFRYVVLGLLRDGAPRHGYALMKRHRGQTGNQISTGNFYRELQHLAAEGLVRAVPRPEGADPRQAPYTITPTGLEAFDRWMAQPSGLGDLGSQDDQLSLRVPFLCVIAPETVRQLLRQWQDDLWLRAKTLERTREAALSETPQVGDGLAVRPLLLSRQIRQVAANVAFLEDFAQSFEVWQTNRQRRAAVPARAGQAKSAQPRSVAATPRTERHAVRDRT
jgi:DNA-binding PadR family transcriptional regulator